MCTDFAAQVGRKGSGHPVILNCTRASVVPVQSLVMTKIQYLSLESIYIIDISIYLDLPHEERTDRRADCQLKE